MFARENTSKLEKETTSYIALVETFKPINFKEISDKKNEYESFRRCFDLVFSICLLILTAPLSIMVAILVKLSSPGPVLHKQQRLTLNGKRFTMYKFRTMRKNAENLTGAVWAKKMDPRVTKLGRLLRKTRLDEIPQLVNIINGDMTLIGPRPERPEMAAKLEKHFPNFSRRLEVKAGLTGLAQVSNGYASDIKSYSKKLAMDLDYIENKSLSLDLQIILKTVYVVFSGKGAH